MKKIMRLTLMLLCSTLSLQAVADKKESFNDFIKDKTYQKGYFSFYHDKNNGKVFLELTQFEKQFIFQSSLPKGIGSNDIGLDRGQLGNTRLVQFENAGDKVFVRELNSYYRANTSNQLEKEAVEEAFASSIIWGFKVAKRSKDNKKILIVTEDKSRLTNLINFFDKEGNYNFDEWYEKLRLEIDEDVPIILICRSGKRSKIIAEMMDKKFDNIIYNAKMRNVSICGATETILMHEKIIKKFGLALAIAVIYL